MTRPAFTWPRCVSVATTLPPTASRLLPLPLFRSWSTRWAGIRASDCVCSRRAYSCSSRPRSCKSTIRSRPTRTCPCWTRRGCKRSTAGHLPLPRRSSAPTSSNMRTQTTRSSRYARVRRARRRRFSSSRRRSASRRATTATLPCSPISRASSTPLRPTSRPCTTCDPTASAGRTSLFTWRTRASTSISSCASSTPLSWHCVTSMPNT